MYSEFTGHRYSDCYFNDLGGANDTKLLYSDLCVDDLWRRSAQGNITLITV